MSGTKILAASWLSRAYNYLFTVTYGSYMEIIREWYPHRNDPNTMYLYYEDMKKVGVFYHGGVLVHYYVMMVNSGSDAGLGSQKAEVQVPLQSRPQTLHCPVCLHQDVHNTGDVMWWKYLTHFKDPLLLPRSS